MTVRSRPAVPVLSAVLLSVALGATACGGSSDGSASAGGSASTSSSESPSTSVSPSPSGSATGGACQYADDTLAPAAKKVDKPPATPTVSGTVKVTLTTNQGDIPLKLDAATAPCAVNSFVSLADQKYYDGSSCSRVLSDSRGVGILQCGDPTGSGSGGPGYTVNDEGTGKETYTAGTIAMARTQEPNSTGSQFFIVYKDSPSLRQGLGLKQYTEFGTVTSGLGVVKTVAAGGASSGTDGSPKLPLTITTMTTSRS